MIRLLKIYLTLVFLLVTTFGMAQKSELKFSKDGKFKIVQFTDVHFKYGNRASDIALERINQVLDDERPDLVIFTGDVVYSAPADSKYAHAVMYVCYNRFVSYLLLIWFMLSHWLPGCRRTNELYDGQRMRRVVSVSP